jgi:Fanconi anemia group M protein
MVGRYLIERKAMLDLAQSIIDGRVFQQLKELKRQNAEIVLIIEGKTIDFTKRLDERVLAGILISIIEDYKVPIYRTATDRESAEIIYTLLQRQIVERKEYHRIRLERKPLEIYEIQKFLLAGIPGIDSVLADKLLTKFGTLEKLAKASLKELVKVEGIGENLAKRIYNVFHETYPKSQRNKLSF